MRTERSFIIDPETDLDGLVGATRRDLDPGGGVARAVDLALRGLRDGGFGSDPKQGWDREEVKPLQFGPRRKNWK